MENDKQTVSTGIHRFYMEKGKICLEFDDYNGLYKGEEAIENFIKQIKKEVTKFKRWKEYKEKMESQPNLFIQKEENGI